jgi:TetR/AcrR family transcriptional regulator
MTRARSISISGPSEVGVKERLLAAAAELFSAKGFSATTTREIVASAGVTKPVLYYYFKNKEGIYLALMRRAMAGFEDVVNAARSTPGSTEERILDLCDRIFGLFMEHLEVARLMYSTYYGPPQGAPFFDFDALHFKLQETIKEIVEEGVRNKRLRDCSVQDMTWAILGSINIAMEVELCHPERSVGRDGLGRVLRVIFDGISPGPGVED